LQGQRCRFGQLPEFPDGLNQTGERGLPVPQRLLDAVFDDPAFLINRLSYRRRQLGFVAG
jgi:hypothetical protein